MQISPLTPAPVTDAADAQAAEHAISHLPPDLIRSVAEDLSVADLCSFAFSHRHIATAVSKDLAKHIRVLCMIDSTLSKDGYDYKFNRALDAITEIRFDRQPALLRNLSAVKCDQDAAHQVYIENKTITRWDAMMTTLRTQIGTPAPSRRTARMQTDLVLAAQLNPVGKTHGNRGAADDAMARVAPQHWATVLDVVITEPNVGHVPVDCIAQMLGAGPQEVDGISTALASRIAKAMTWAEASAETVKSTLHDTFNVRLDTQWQAVDTAIDEAKK